MLTHNNLSTRTEYWIVATFHYLQWQRQSQEINSAVHSSFPSCPTIHGGNAGPIHLLSSLPSRVCFCSRSRYRIIHLGITRLPYTEQQRWLTQGLCLYCGVGGHQFMFHSSSTFCGKFSPRSISWIPVVVNLTVPGISVSVAALIVSGSAKNLISGNFCHKLKL